MQFPILQDKFITKKKKQEDRGEGFNFLRLCFNDECIYILK